jgi:hypothetical protein
MIIFHEINYLHKSRDTSTSHTKMEGSGYEENKPTALKFHMRLQQTKETGEAKAKISIMAAVDYR